MPGVIATLKPVKVFMQVFQSNKEVGSILIFQIIRLFGDVEDVICRGLVQFKRNLLRFLHEQLDCYQTHYPYQVAMYLNCNIRDVLFSDECMIQGIGKHSHHTHTEHPLSTAVCRPPTWGPK